MLTAPFRGLARCSGGSCAGFFLRRSRGLLDQNMLVFAGQAPRPYTDRGWLVRSLSSAEGGLVDVCPEELALLLPVGAPLPSGAQDRRDPYPVEGGFLFDGHSEGVSPERCPIGIAPAIQHGFA